MTTSSTTSSPVDTTSFFTINHAAFKVEFARLVKQEVSVETAKIRADYDTQMRRAAKVIKTLTDTVTTLSTSPKTKKASKLSKAHTAYPKITPAQEDLFVGAHNSAANRKEAHAAGLAASGVPHSRIYNKLWREGRHQILVKFSLIKPVAV